MPKENSWKLDKDLLVYFKNGQGVQIMIIRYTYNLLFHIVSAGNDGCNAKLDDEEIFRVS